MSRKLDYIPRPKARKFEISKEELQKLVWEIPTTKIGEMYGVSDKAIEKRCKLFGIEKPPRGYWQQKKARERAQAGSGWKT